MTGRRVLPDAAELNRMRAQGMTLREIVDDVCTATGERVTVAAISAALHRAGYGAERIRYESLIPWRVQMRHQKNYHVRMLRLEGRRRAGHKLRQEEERRLVNWIEELKEKGAVIHYNPSYGVDGFYPVPARPGIDTDLIRVPDEVAA